MSKTSKGIGYRYKLNENWKGPDTNVSVEGINLSRDWKVFSSKQYKLENRIRNILNPKGIVDVEEYSLDDGSILFSSLPEKIEFNKTIIFKKEELESFDRNRLTKIARFYRIDPIRKTNDFIIRLILQKQREVIEKNKKKIDLKDQQLNKPEEV